MCLLGEEVRHDGGHKRDRYVTEVVARYFDWIPVCPEVDLGMGTPREPIHLVQTADGVRLAGVETGEDWTQRMATYAESRVTEIETLGIDGYIVKKGSPSCGARAVELQHPDGSSTPNAVGAFARVLAARLPELPIVEEDQLVDAATRKSFVERARAHYRRRMGESAG